MNTYAQTAEKLGRKISYVKYLVKKRRLAVVNMGHKTKMITDAEIQRFITSRTQKAIA